VIHSRPVRRLLAAAGSAALLAGCGGSDSDRAGDLAWARPPSLLRASSDRVVTGAVRNTGLRRLEISAREMRLVDDRGGRIEGIATFSPGYQHGLYPPTRIPKSERAAQDRQLGLTIALDPGKQAKLTVAWRTRRGARPPVRVTYRDIVLPIPRDRSGAPG